ncbi:MAG: mechanosensitive ion channel family protein [Ignavibacteriaceae bacterium]
MGKDKTQPSVEDLKQEAEIKEQLTKTSTVRNQKKNVNKSLWFITYTLFLLIFGVVLYLLSINFFGLSENALSILKRITRGAMLVTIVLALTKVIQIYFITSLRDEVNKYNFNRILRLIVTLIICFIVITSLFINWQTAFISLGIISLIIGFSLQTALTSFIGWIYILIRKPYRVGDRIKIGDATGDVIDVSYFDTTLWEFGGQYLSTDHPSGRIIKFPNSEVMNNMVYNYSWPLFPYIWNEIKFNIAYNSDLEFVDKVMREAAEEEIGKTMIERIETYRKLLSETPVDELEVHGHPSVVFRISDNTWIEAIVRYLVMPKEQGAIKTRLIKKMLARLNKEPNRVKFPNDNMR